MLKEKKYVKTLMIMGGRMNLFVSYLHFKCKLCLKCVEPQKKNKLNTIQLTLNRLRAIKSPVKKLQTQPITRH